MLDKDEEEKRKELARQIINNASIEDTINSINYANANNMKIGIKNDSEQNFINKVNEANRVINSINPRKNILTAQKTKEDEMKSLKNTQNFLNLMDRNTVEEVDYNHEKTNEIKDNKEIVNNIENEKQNLFSSYANRNKVQGNRKTSDLISKTIESKDRDKNLNQQKENFENYITKKKSSMEAVSKSLQENAKKQQEMVKEKQTLIQQVNNEFKKQNPATVSNEIKNKELDIDIEISPQSQTQNAKVMTSSDMFDLTNGAIDKRSQAQKNIDNIFSIAGNIGMGAEGVIPSISRYINSAGKLATKKAGSYLANMLLHTDKETSNIIGDLVFSKLWEYTELGKIDNQLNSEELQRWRKETIAKNVQKTTNGITRKIAEVAPSVGENLVPMAISYFNPVVGSTLFMTSAAGNYLEEAQERGMDEEEAFTYATIMGILEGGTESVISTNMLSRTKKIFTGVGISDKVLNSFGVSSAENFLQEAIMEPLQELTATIVVGEESANWDNILNRTLEAGIDGVLSSILLNGASIGISSAGNVLNKPNPTVEEIQRALSDTINSGKIDLNKIISVSQTAIKDGKYFLNSEDLFIANYNSQEELENIQETKGIKIENINTKLNISPAVVLENDNFIIIDSETGLKLDTYNYQTQTEAIKKFDDKIRNLDEASIKNINDKITKSKLTLYNQLQSKNISERNNIKNQIKIDSENFAKQVDDVKNIKENKGRMLYDIDEGVIKKYRDNPPRLQLSNDIIPIRDTNISVTNSITQKSKSVKNDNKKKYTAKQYNDITDTINQISDKTLYNKEKANKVFNIVSNNIENVNYIEQSGKNYLNSLDNEGNVVHQQKLDSKIYSGKKIKEIINTAIQNANITQTSSQQNTDKISFNETNYAVKDIKKVIEPFNANKSYSKEEMAEIWNNEISSKNYDAYYNNDGAIERYIAIEEDGDNIVVSQYDSNDNMIKSAVIPAENGRYSAKAIKNTIERVSSLYNENRLTEEFNARKQYKNVTELLNAEVEKAENNFNTNIKIEQIDELENINFKKITQNEYIKLSKNIFKNSIKKRSFQNDNSNIKIKVILDDIKESAYKAYSNKFQNKYLKEHIQALSKIDIIIENANEKSKNIETKSRNQYKDWKYFISKVIINDKPFLIEFDVTNKNNSYHFRLQRLVQLNLKNNRDTTLALPKNQGGANSR